MRYKQQRNKVNNLKRNAKENFEKNLDTIILENASNSKEYWKLMKMLIKSNKPSYNLPPLKNIVDGIEANIIYDENEKYDLFNKYFNCISGIDDENVLLPDFESRTGSSISDILCTEEEIVDVITNLAVNKASGPDIAIKLCRCPLKKLMSHYEYFLTNLSNSANILWFFASFRKFSSENTRGRIFSSFVARSANFFPEFNNRLYDKNSESDYFFSSTKIRIFFFSNIGNQNMFFRKKNHNPPPPPPPLQVKWSFPYGN